MLAFFEGAMVIVVELLGTKTIIPVLGNSLVIWTAIISVTIGFLCLGYYIGGRLSKKDKAISYLSKSLSLASVFIALIPVLSLKYLDTFLNDSLITSSLLISIFLIGPPILLLAISSPLIIQLLGEKILNSGKSAGYTYAISTLGGILSTLFIAYYLLPNYGLVLPLTVLAIVLFIVSGILKFSYFQLALTLILLLTSFKNLESEEETTIPSYQKIVAISEGLMGQLKVVDEFNPIEKLPYRMLLINGICQTKIVNNPEKVSAWTYIHQISMIASFKRGGDALLLGMGGGTIASELQKLDCSLDAVDIDERMFDYAKKYFYFKPTKTKIFVDDARHFLRKSVKKYDVIILDLLNGESQPTNVFTYEGVRELKRNLNNNGICIMEFQELIHHSLVSKSIINTFLDAGFKVQINRNSNQEGASHIDDIIIVVSLNDLDFSKYDKSKLSASYKFLGPVAGALDNPFQKINTPYTNIDVFTDDKPVIDILNAKTIQTWRQNSNNTFSKKHLQDKLKIFN